MKSKINGLLIEDDQNKASKILTLMTETFGQRIVIEHRESYQAGIQIIFDFDFDFILLDMSLPMYVMKKGMFAGKPKNFGGRDILKEMKRYKKQSKILIVTQYNEFSDGITDVITLENLSEQLLESFPDLYHGYVYFNSRQSDWKQGIIDFVNLAISI